MSEQTIDRPDKVEINNNPAPTQEQPDKAEQPEKGEAGADKQEQPDTKVTIENK